MDPLYKVKTLVGVRSDKTEGNTYAHSIQDALYKLVDLYPELEVEDVFSIKRHICNFVTVTATVSLYVIAKDHAHSFSVAEKVIRSIALDDSITVLLFESHIVQPDEPFLDGWDEALIWQDPDADEVLLSHAQYRDAYWNS